MYWAVEYLASFVEYLLGIYFCGIFVKKENNQKEKAIILAALVAIITFFLNKIELFSYLTIGNFIVWSVIIQWIYYRRKYLLLAGSVLVYILSVFLVDLVVLYFISFVMNNNIDYILEEQSFLRLVSIFLSKSIMIIIVASLNRIIPQKCFIPSLYTIILGLCSIFLLLSNMVLLHFEWTLSKEISTLSRTFLIASIGIEILVFFLVLKIAQSYEQEKTNLLIEMKNRMLQQTLDETEQAFELWRHSIHDYKNHMIVLRNMADEGRYEEIQSFIDEKSELMEKKLFYIRTGNAVADTIIRMKQSVADTYHIPFMVQAGLPSKLVVSDIDIANILGNLLDNALEACKQEEQPYINIILKEKGKCLLFDICNCCTRKIDEAKSGKVDVQFHGIGLKSVKKTVAKYNGEMLIEQKNEEYRVSIVIQNEVPAE